MKYDQKVMKVSACITYFNESDSTIANLINALKLQTLKPDEIILIDAKDYNNCSRSKGRNIAIKKAKNKTIAITDAGCIPHKNWLRNITKPFIKGDVDVVAGGYRMVAKNSFQKACSIFLGIDSKKIKDDFIPSARSMAFTKNIWKKVGGFPEELRDTAEDTIFNLNLINISAKFVNAKDAVVDWLMPTTINEFANKIYRYAKGDAVSGVWWHPTKKLKTHNIKVLTIFLRYILFVYYPVLIFVYIFYAYLKAKWWGIVLQFVSDFTAIIGFSHGLLQTSVKRD